MNEDVSAGIVNQCRRCRLFATYWTDGWELTDIQKLLIQIIHGGHDAR